MASLFIDVIKASDPAIRDQAFDVLATGLSTSALVEEAKALDLFRRQSENLYERVRALTFLYAIHRYALTTRPEVTRGGLIPFEGYEHLLNRRFEEAVDFFLLEMKRSGPSDAISSALAATYKDLAFATLAAQVRRSVRSVRGNQWMFRVGHGADHPLRIRPELLRCSAETGLFPLLAEKTPVRMDLSLCGQSIPSKGEGDTAH